MKKFILLLMFIMVFASFGFGGFPSCEHRTSEASEECQNSIMMGIEDLSQMHALRDAAEKNIRRQSFRYNMNYTLRIIFPLCLALWGFNQKSTYGMVMGSLCAINTTLIVLEW